MLDLNIIRFCAIECEMQGSGERSVWWMATAYDYAMRHADEKPTDEHVRVIGSLVEPGLNAIECYRKMNVQVGSDIKVPWRHVPQAMNSLLDHGSDLTPAEWFKEFEEIHPFYDGNGRSGAILFNWLSGTLDDPKWAPNFWHDFRRAPGDGA
jgi:hypothetical protein